MRIVRFNDTRNGYYIGCSQPDNLEQNRIYEVFSVKDYGHYQLYKLVGVEGEYPACWFTWLGESRDRQLTQLWRNISLPQSEDGWLRIL